ncbi:MAG: response regulator, partial [Terricaulis sp.]
MNPQPPRARVAIVEDDPILREDVAQMVARAEGLEIAGVADALASGRTLLEPGLDVLLIDLALPDGNGVELIREAR